MKNRDDYTSDEEQLTPLPMDYLTLLAVTRPLVITRQNSEALGAQIHEDKAISLQLSNWWVEFALRKGVIICGGVPIGGRQNEQGPTSTPALPKRGSDLRIRIHLGMS